MDDKCTPSPLMPLDELEDKVESHFGHLPNHEDLREGELSQLSLLDDQMPATSPDGRSSPILPNLIPPAVEPQMAEPRYRMPLRGERSTLEFTGDGRMLRRFWEDLDHLLERAAVVGVEDKMYWVTVYVSKDNRFLWKDIVKAQVTDTGVQRGLT